MRSIVTSDDVLSYRHKQLISLKAGKMFGTILVIDDDSTSNRRFEKFLRRNGFSVVVETDGNRAVGLIVDKNPQLVILNILLPGLDGLSICRQVGNSFDGPILMLTSVSDELDEVASLETGADAYLAKPVQPRVLLAHIRALLRRTDSKLNDIDDSVYPNGRKKDPLEIGRIKISASRRMVSLDGRPIRLTSGEFEILWLLAKHAGQVLSRDILHNHLRGLEHDGLDRTVDQRISKIRKKLGDNPRRQTIIKSVRGVGYLLVK